MESATCIARPFSSYFGHLEERVFIYLNFDEYGRRKISGKTMRRCVEEQKLDATFGTPDHDIPGGLRCRACGGRGTGSAGVTKRKYD